MNSRSRVRGHIGIAGVFAALTIFGALPASAAADPVGDLFNGLGLGGSADGGQGQGTGQSSVSASNPHAQGTVAKLDITAPDGVDDGGLLDDEEVVVGRSRAEQSDDESYQGHVTILALFGEEIIGIESGPGATALSPFQPLQGLLDQVCSGTSGALCVAVLPASSATGDSGSKNDFGVLRATSTVGGNELLNAGAAESNASLEEDGQCQTAAAGASVARADLLSAIKVRVLQSMAQAVACQGSTPSQTSDSTIVSVNDQNVPLPGDCAEGTNGGFGILSLVSVSCNVAGSIIGPDSAAGGQDALVVGAIGDDPPLAAATASGTETGASSAGPEAGGPIDSAPGSGGPAGEGAGGNGGGADDGADDGAGGPAAGEASSGDGSLAFTGVNAALMAVIGLALLGMGIGLTSRYVRPPIGG